MAETILTTEYSEEMQKSYLDYSMSVITSRAVPDIRDGLKPVQRRVLYDMNELNVHFDKPTLKSARICGDTMGKYHPHGDSSIYETLVVMAQDFKKMQPLVKGQGNFGSIEGDSAAAPRYTEAKLEKFTDDVMLRDIKTTVNFQPNYDEKLKEPEVLPARLPNFLINGSEGIAVGMTTSTPSHNLIEIIDLISAYIDNKEITLDEMLKIMPGPDFPTGGIIANKSDILDIYRKGTGRLKLRGKMEFEKGKKRTDKDKLVITEIPFTMTGQGMSRFMQDTADLVESKVLPEITNISNESQDNIRIVLDLKNNADIDRIKNILYAKTRLEDTFSVNMLAIVNGKPEVLSLRRVLEEYMKFQYFLIERKYNNLLENELINKEIKEGLIEAVDLIDAIIAVLRSVRSRAKAKEVLCTGNIEELDLRYKGFADIIKRFHFTDRQADAILDMKLVKLIGLEMLELQKAYEDSVKKIKKYKSILSSRKNEDKLLLKELLAIKKEYGKERKTLIEDGKEAIYKEDAFKEMDVYYLQDRFGYSRTIDTATFERNKEAALSENVYVVSAKNTDNIIFFTDKGNMHQIKLRDVPLCKFRDKGVPIDNLSKFTIKDERILFLDSKEHLKGKSLIFVTCFSMIKRVEASEFDTVNRCVIGTKLSEGDKLSDVKIIENEDELVLRTDDDYFLRFSMEEVPLQGKNTIGVIGMKLGKSDFIKEMYLLSGEAIEIPIKGEKPLCLNRLKKSSRNTKGTKPRG